MMSQCCKTTMEKEDHKKINQKQFMSRLFVLFCFKKKTSIKFTYFLCFSLKLNNNDDVLC